MRAKEKYCSAGLVYFYVVGIKHGDNRMIVDAIDSLHYLPDGFCTQVSEMSSALSDNCLDGTEIFGVIDSCGRAESVMDIVLSGLRDNYIKKSRGEKVLTESVFLDEYGNSFFKTVQEYFYERDDCIPGVHKTETKEWELYYICKCGEKSLRYAENALNIWLNTEQPQTSGKQLVTRSFLFGDLVGRKVVAGVSDYENGSLDIIFEGGIKLPTGNGETFMGEKLDFGEIHEIGVSQIDIIINNPGRAYGKFFFLLD